MSTSYRSTRAILLAAVLAGTMPGVIAAQRPLDLESLEILSAARAELERARAVLLAGGGRSQRLGAAYSLVHLASAAPQLRSEVLPLLEELSADRNSEIAALALTTIVRIEGRGRTSTEPLPALSSALVPDRLGFRSPEEEEDFGKLDSPNSHLRLAGLERILHRTLSQGRRDDPRVLDAFIGLLDDPDPRVAHRAGNALLGLAGDTSAFANVYVRER